MSRKTMLPAGEYYIGDPCYVIEAWDDFLEPFWDTNGGGIFDFDGYDCCVFQTQYGDGRYPASDGSSLPVDAGIIGAIPAVLMTTGDFEEGTRVSFNRPFECSRDDDGRLHFGSFSVMTGDGYDDYY